MLRADALRFGQKIFELDAGVADDAGIGRLTPEITLRKGAADLFLQLRLHVQHGEGNADKFRRADGVLPGGPVRIVQIQPDHLMSRLLQQLCGHGGVHSAGKSKDDFAHFLLSI